MKAEYKSYAERLIKNAELSSLTYDTNQALARGYEVIPLTALNTPVLGLNAPVVYLFNTEMVKGKGTHHIAIRGTANLRDLVRDFEGAKTLDSDLDFEVHSGFAAAARSIHDDLQQSNRLKRGYAVTITGHSMGGAIGVLLAMYLQQLSGLTVAEVTTFGQPKVVTNDGARNFPVLNQNILRVVGCDDVIPFLPPPPLIGWSRGGYQHVGRLLLLLDGVYFDLVDGGDIERLFVEALRSELQSATDKDKDQLFFAHRMSQYLTSLLAKAKDYRPVHYNERDIKACAPKGGENTR